MENKTKKKNMTHFFGQRLSGLLNRFESKRSRIVVQLGRKRSGTVINGKVGVISGRVRQQAVG